MAADDSMLQRLTAADLRPPPSRPGMRIGLFGGSFDPVHPGHLMVARLALARLGLDRLWWLVSPQNPLKPAAPSAELAARLAAVRRAAAGPRVAVTGFEAAIGARYSVETVAWLVRHRPGVRFVWVLGADSFAAFHRWNDWRRIAAMVPIAVVDRPGSGLVAVASPAARALARARIRETEARTLAECLPPAWVFLHGPRIGMSSSELRAKRSGRAS